MMGQYWHQHGLLVSILQHDVFLCYNIYVLLFILAGMPKFYYYLLLCAAYTLLIVKYYFAHLANA